MFLACRYNWRSVNKQRNVTIEGLQFEQYQMDWIEPLAKLEGQTPVCYVILDETVFCS